jgi:pimeloyl-ACP methyl ester carboxylesterase
MNRQAQPGLPETVILVHGLWMSGLELRYLGRRLQRCGFAVRYFRYPSWRGDLSDAALRLGELVGRTGGERVHLVGHSLGGVVIAKMLELTPQAKPGLVAVLGSPLRGSALADALYRSRFGRFVLGSFIGEGIVANKPVWPAGRKLLVIAGTMPLGFGFFFGLSSPHDGTVAEAETRVAGAESMLVRASHMGMVISATVADILCNFFRRG